MYIMKAPFILQSCLPLKDDLGEMSVVNVSISALYCCSDVVARVIFTSAACPRKCRCGEWSTFLKILFQRRLLYSNNLYSKPFMYRPKHGFIWGVSFVVTTSNVNFDPRPILQPFGIAVCAVSQQLSRKITKKFCMLLYFWTHILKMIL